MIDTTEKYMIDTTEGTELVNTTPRKETTTRNILKDIKSVSKLVSKLLTKINLSKQIRRLSSCFLDQNII